MCTVFIFQQPYYLTLIYNYSIAILIQEEFTWFFDFLKINISIQYCVFCYVSSLIYRSVSLVMTSCNRNCRCMDCRCTDSLFLGKIITNYYSKNNLTEFKNLNLQNHCANFNQTWQKASFGDRDLALFQVPRGDNYEKAKIHWRFLIYPPLHFTLLREASFRSLASPIVCHLFIRRHPPSSSDKPVRNACTHAELQAFREAGHQTSEAHRCHQFCKVYRSLIQVLILLVLP